MLSVAETFEHIAQSVERTGGWRRAFDPTKKGATEADVPEACARATHPGGGYAICARWSGGQPRTCHPVTVMLRNSLS